MHHSAVFCALHDQLASLGRYAQLTRCFSAVAELLVFTALQLQWSGVVGYCCTVATGSASYSLQRDAAAGNLTMSMKFTLNWPVAMVIKHGILCGGPKTGHYIIDNNFVNFVSDQFSHFSPLET